MKLTKADVLEILEACNDSEDIVLEFCSRRRIAVDGNIFYDVL